MSRELNVGLKGFMMDLAGERRRAQRLFDNTVHNFCTMVFDKMTEEFKKSPHAKFYMTSIKSSEFKDFEAISDMLVYQRDSIRSALKEATDDLGMRVNFETDAAFIKVEFTFEK